MTRYIRFGVVLCMLLCTICCGFLIYFQDDSGITVFPATENQILAADEYPSICFDFEVDRNSVEMLFSIEDAGSVLQGLFEWDGYTIAFKTHSEMVPGRRYVLSFCGVYCDTKGVEYSANWIVPFYYQRRDESAPYVIGSEPESGTTFATGKTIRILFSEAIDPGSLHRGFSIDPDTPVLTSWENDQTELVVTPKESWRNCCCYTIILDDEIRDIAGTPMAGSTDLVFWIQEDIEPPTVLSVVPVFNLPAQLYPETGLSIEEPVGLKEGLRFTFSEAMDTNNAAAALSVHPAVILDTVWLDASILVAVPAGSFAADTDYSINFDEEATDLFGNPISLLQSFEFTTVPAIISVTTDLVNDGIQLASEDYSTTTAIEIEPFPITSSADYVFSFSFTDAIFHSNSEKMTAQDAISLSCIFPDTGVADPIVTGISWTGDQHVSITYSDLQFSTSIRYVYYLLRIRGGPNGVVTDDGMFLPEDLQQLLVTVVE